MTPLGPTRSRVGKSAPETYHEQADLVRPGALRATRERGHRPFEQSLQRRRLRTTRGSGSSPDSQQSAEFAGGPLSDGASLKQWFRPESRPESVSRPAVPVRAPLRIQPHQKILVSVGDSTPQARIHIDGGKLAGTQIQLTMSGSRVEAHLLTANQSSRQTLVVAMEAVRDRLRTRVGAAPPPAQAQGRGLPAVGSPRIEARPPSPAGRSWLPGEGQGR